MICYAAAVLSEDMATKGQVELQVSWIKSETKHLFPFGKWDNGIEFVHNMNINMTTQSFVREEI